MISNVCEYHVEWCYDWVCMLFHDIICINNGSGGLFFHLGPISDEVNSCKMIQYCWFIKWNAL